MARTRTSLPLRAAALLLAAAPAAAAVTIVHVSPLDLREARVEGLRPAPFEKGLLQGSGTVESGLLEAFHPFDDVVASLNADVPPGARAELAVQARIDGRWTSWYGMLVLDAAGASSPGRQEDADGFVDVDTLRLRRKADALRYRVSLVSPGKGKALLRRVAVAYEDLSSPPAAASAPAQGPWTRELAVPAHSQMEQQEDFRRDICSPTSLAMVLQYWKKGQTVASVARAVQDRASGLYGNWPANVAYAASRGLSGQVARLPGFAALEAEIAAGRPVVVSVSFGPGELSGAPLKKTSGHLMVVAGFTPEGDVIVRDPAGPSRGSVRRVYRRAEFARAWLANKRGLAYLLRPRFPMDGAVGAASADLRAKPRAPARAEEHDDERLSQALYGEPLVVLKAKGEWAYVRLPRQQRRRGKAWTGYEGWLPASALRVPPLPYEAGASVRRRRAEAVRAAEDGKTKSQWLPMGAYLSARAEKNAFAARLLGGRSARLPEGSLTLAPLPARQAREEIVRAAAEFLGARYVWGGLSGAQPREDWGVDCSGLVHAAYRAAGAQVPRDAQDQFARARRLKPAELRAGDLVFLTASSRSDRINHVLLYAGGERLLESRAEPGLALETTFQERFGRPLRALADGAVFEDRTGPRPRARRLRFGGLLED